MQRMTRDGRCSLPAEEGITPRRTMLVWGTIVLLAALGTLLLFQSVEKLGQENARTAMPDTFHDVNASKPRRLPRFAASVIGSPAALPFGSGEASREDEVADDAEKDVVREQPARCGTTDYYCQPKVALWERLNALRASLSGLPGDTDAAENARHELRKVIYYLLRNKTGEMTDDAVVAQFLKEWKDSENSVKDGVSAAIAEALYMNGDYALIERHSQDLFSDWNSYIFTYLIAKGKLFGGQLPDAFYPPGSKARKDAEEIFPQFQSTEKLLAVMQDSFLSPERDILEVLRELDRRGVNTGIPTRIKTWVFKPLGNTLSSAEEFVMTASIEELVPAFTITYRSGERVVPFVLFKAINDKNPALAEKLLAGVKDEDHIAKFSALRGGTCTPFLREIRLCA